MSNLLTPYRYDTGFSPPAGSFVIRVKTDNTGTSDNDQFRIPTVAGSYNIYTSDGQEITGISGSHTITFPSLGTYDIAINGGFTKIFFNAALDCLKLVDILSWGTLTSWTTFASAFRGCNNLTSVTATDALDFGSATSAGDMFANCTNMTSIDVSNWNVSSLTAMTTMFNNCQSLTYLDVSGWDVSNVTAFYQIFNNCFVLDTTFEDWDISSATNMLGFVLGGKISSANYSATLVAWDALVSTPSNISIQMGDSRYFEGGTAETARTNLISTHGWVIVDNGYTAEILPLASIISQWKMNGNSNDFVGSNNGTDTSMSYVSGLVGNCADFTGSALSRIQVSDDDSLSFGDGSTDSAFSISFLVKFDAAFTSVQLISKEVYGGVAEYRINIASPNLVYFMIADGAMANRIGYRTKNLYFSTDRWYHIVCTYDGSGLASGLNIYLDSVNKNFAAASAGSYTAMENTTAPLSFGSMTPPIFNALDGYMDCVTLWDKELSSAEVRLLSDEELVAKTDINP